MIWGEIRCKTRPSRDWPAWLALSGALTAAAFAESIVDHLVLLLLVAAGLLVAAVLGACLYVAIWWISPAGPGWLEED